MEELKKNSFLENFTANSFHKLSLEFLKSQLQRATEIPECVAFPCFPPFSRDPSMPWATLAISL